MFLTSQTCFLMLQQQGQRLKALRARLDVHITWSILHATSLYWHGKHKETQWHTWNLWSCLSTSASQSCECLVESVKRRFMHSAKWVLSSTWCECSTSDNTCQRTYNTVNIRHYSTSNNEENLSTKYTELMSRNIFFGKVQSVLDR